MTKSCNRPVIAMKYYNIFHLLIYCLCYIIINIVCVFYCIRNESFSYVVFFLPMIRDSLYFIIGYFILRTNVVLDVHGGENQYNYRRIIAVLFTSKNDSLMSIRYNIKRLTMQRIQNGIIDIYIVNDGATDISTLSQNIRPSGQMIVNEKYAMLVSSLFNNTDINYVIFTESILPDKASILNKIIARKPSDMLFVTECGILLNDNNIQRLSNIIIANPRISFVCGIDITFDGIGVFNKLLKRNIQNKTGKYIFLNDSGILMFNTKHPSIIKHNIDFSNTRLLSHSNRTWGLCDPYSTRYKLDTLDITLTTIDTIKNTLKYPRLIPESILDCTIGLTGLTRFVIFIYYSINHDNISVFETLWLKWFTVIIFSLTVLNSFVISIKTNIYTFFWTFVWCNMVRIIDDFIHFFKLLYFIKITADEQI